MQGHLFQIFTLAAMERPQGTDGIRNAKTKLLRDLRRQRGRQLRRNTVRAQYDGYLQEPGVDGKSRTETYVAHRAYVDNKRWRGVPFVLETGKALSKKEAVIRVELRKLSPEIASRLGVRANQPGTLTIDVTGELQASLELDEGKVDLAPMLRKTRKLKGREAYSRLIGAAVKGDTSPFVRSDEAELTWSYLRPVQREWKRKTKRLTSYAKGALRPGRAQRLFRQRGRQKLRRLWHRGKSLSRRAAKAVSAQRRRLRLARKGKAKRKPRRKLRLRRRRAALRAH
jgi:glucose-6-phosphate 1-dehydrogenase